MTGLRAPDMLRFEDSSSRVLVVEDDQAISAQLVRGLTLAGYVTTAVSTGRDALRAGPADVVVLDLGLPDMDGIEICSQLRARFDGAIIVVTARDDEADRVLALDRGADDYIVKPFGRAELLARIRAVLRRTRAPDAEVLGTAILRWMSGPAEYRSPTARLSSRARSLTSWLVSWPTLAAR